MPSRPLPENAAGGSIYHYHDASHDLRQLIETLLARNGCLGGRSLSIDVHGDEVVLRGVVRSYYLKQLAQESLKSLEGVGSIRNEIEVISL